MHPTRQVVLVFVFFVLIACKPGGELALPPVSPQTQVVPIDGGVRLNWESVHAANHYRVYVSPDDQGSPGRIDIYVVEDTDLVLDGLEIGRRYRIDVTALGEGGESPAYTIAVTPQRIPAAPQSVEATNSSGTITLSWSEVSGANGYNVYVVPASNLQASNDVHQAPRLIVREQIAGFTHTETGLENGTEYAFFVTAVNASGESEFSTLITATPVPHRGLVAGNSHTCVVDDAAALLCWGSNAVDQLGDLGAKVARKPLKVTENAKWKHIAPGWDQTCGVNRDESLLCWGAGSVQPAIITVDTVPPTSGGSYETAEDSSSRGTTWQQPSTAGSSACATRSDGSLWCWGVGGMLSPQEPLRRIGLDTDWVKISNGDWNRCGIKRNGTLWCWGENSIGQVGDGTRDSRRQPTAVTTREKWLAVSASAGLGRSIPYPRPPGIPLPPPQYSQSYGHTCGITEDAHLWCWGLNLTGQLGTGSFDDSALPQEVSGGGAWRTVAAAPEHTCGIKVDGSLWCWGSNQFGQLGVEDPRDQTAPQRVGDDFTWIEVTVGEFHTCASRRDGSIWCAGRNDVGQLGIDSNPYQAEPKLVLRGVTAVSATEMQTCAIRLDGSLWCSGLLGKVNQKRFIGNFAINVQRSILRHKPVAIALPSGVIAAHVTGFSWGGMHGLHAICVLDQQARIWCQDVNYEEQDFLRFTSVQGQEPWVSLSLGYRYSCGIRQDASLYCWSTGGGTNYSGFGQINLAAPQLVDGSSPWTEVKVGYEHVCALNVEHELWCWGRNAEGQLGLGHLDTMDASAPLRAAPKTKWRTVATGSKHTCSISRTDLLWCWGDNSAGQLGIGAGRSQSPEPTRVAKTATWASVSAEGDSTCAIRTDSSLWCWGVIGENSTIQYEPLQVGNETGWTSVVVSYGHQCATKADGDLYCWGRNDYGQIGDGSAWSTTWRRVKFDVI